MFTAGPPSPFPFSLSPPLFGHHQERASSAAEAHVGPSLLTGRHAACHHRGACLAHAAAGFGRAALIAFGVRVGVGLLTRAWQLARASPASLIDIELLLSDASLKFREDGVRLGAFAGGFVGTCPPPLSSVYSAAACLCAQPCIPRPDTYALTPHTFTPHTFTPHALRDAPSPPSCSRSPLPLSPYPPPPSCRHVPPCALPAAALG